MASQRYFKFLKVQKLVRKCHTNDDCSISLKPGYLYELYLGLKLIMLFSKISTFAKNMSKLLNLTRNICSRILNINCKSELWEEVIIKNTVLSRNHLTLELQLRLITAECELWHSKDSESPFPNDPFWGIYWPGGQALGRYLLDNKKVLYQKTVLDLGSGSGACALAAAKSGAKFVLANDIDPVSISAIHINSRLNNLKVYTSEEDLLQKDIDSLIIENDGQTFQTEWNVILLGDMFYDSEFSCKLCIWLSKLVKKNKSILIGDPGRHALKELEPLKDFGSIIKIAEYDLCDREHNGFLNSSVYKFKCQVRQGYFLNHHLGHILLKIRHSSGPKARVKVMWPDVIVE